MYIVREKISGRQFKLCLPEGKIQNTYDMLYHEILNNEKVPKQNHPFHPKELAAVMEDILGLNDVEHKFTGGKKGWTGDVAKMLLSTKKLEELGWKPKLSFKESMKLYIDWLKTLKK